MKKSKSVVIAMSIVLVSAIVAVIFAYLFFMTDVLKSNEELFIKYFAQNEEIFRKITDFKTIKVYENLKNENKYESNTNIKMIHSEGGEISNPLNNLSLKLDIQKNNEEQYVYTDGQILYEDEEYLETEIIKEKEIYGIRFSDAVQQFVTIKKGENTEQVANDMNIDVEILESLLNIIDGEKHIITTDQIDLLKNEFLDIITKNILTGTFEKEKNTTITYNEIATKTNSYSVSLTSDQVEVLMTELLNCMESKIRILDKFEVNIDEIIEKTKKQLQETTMKITLYEQEQKLIRTDINMDFGTIIMENVNKDEKIITKISYSNNKRTTQYAFEINKNNINNQEVFDMICNIKKDNENYKIIFSAQMQVIDNNIEFDAEISRKQNITTISMILENNVKLLDDFERKENLNEQNNFLISNFEEQKRKQFISLLQNIVKPKINERIKLLIQKFAVNNQ